MHASREWGKYPPEDLVRFVMGRWGSLSKEERKKITVLDLGCGQGASAWFLAREGFTVTGVDFASSAVEKARAYLSAEGLEAELTVADFRALPFPKGSFNLVVDIESVYANTREDIKKIYRNAYLLLKDGGAFFTMCFSTECSNFGVGRKIEEGTYADIPEGSPRTGLAHYFEKAELEALFKRAGFREVKIDKKDVTRSAGSEKMSQFIAYGIA